MVKFEVIFKLQIQSKVTPSLPPSNVSVFGHGAAALSSPRGMSKQFVSQIVRLILLFKTTTSGFFFSFFQNKCLEQQKLCRE